MHGNQCSLPVTDDRPLIDMVPRAANPNLKSAGQSHPPIEQCANPLAPMQSSRTVPEPDLSCHETNRILSRAEEARRERNLAVLFPEADGSLSLPRSPLTSAERSLPRDKDSRSKTFVPLRKTSRQRRTSASSRAASKGKKVASIQSTPLTLNPDNFIDVPLSYQQALDIAGSCGLDASGLTNCLQFFPPLANLAAPPAQHAQPSTSNQVGEVSEDGASASILYLHDRQPPLVTPRSGLQAGCIRFDPHSSDNLESEEDQAM